MKSRNELVEEVVQEFEKIAPYEINGRDTSDYAEKLKAFLRSSLLRISNASFEAVGVEKVDEDEALFADDPDKKLSEGYSIGYNSAITASRERRLEWCEERHARNCRNETLNPPY